MCLARVYLEADVPAPLPHHLQLHRLVVATLPQFQPHLIIDVKQVMGITSGIAEHLLRQRPRITTEETTSPISPREPRGLVRGVKASLAPFVSRILSQPIL